MADAVEELRIEIDAKASKANDAIDRLVGKLDRLTTSLNKVEGFGSKLTTMSAGVQRLSIAMQGMNNVKNKFPCKSVIYRGIYVAGVGPEPTTSGL